MHALISADNQPLQDAYIDSQVRLCDEGLFSILCSTGCTLNELVLNKKTLIFTDFLKGKR